VSAFKVALLMSIRDERKLEGANNGGGSSHGRRVVLVAGW
jgi:hypothetical protein